MFYLLGYLDREMKIGVEARKKKGELQHWRFIKVRSQNRKIRASLHFIKNFENSMAIHFGVRY